MPLDGQGQVFPRYFYRADVNSPIFNGAVKSLPKWYDMSIAVVSVVTAVSVCTAKRKTVPGQATATKAWTNGKTGSIEPG
jgi:hypothetical protein